MAAAQVAKKLKDRRQRQTLEEIFKKVDRDGNGTVSLAEYFGIFEEHGVKLSTAETNRVVKLAGTDGTLSKDQFIKILRSSNFFLKTFDKNSDGIVSETEMTTRAELAFKALDKDNSGYITEKEMRKLSTKLSEKELGAIMRKLDADGDGRLTLEEFRKLFPALKRGNSPRPEMKHPGKKTQSEVVNEGVKRRSDKIVGSSSNASSPDGSNIAQKTEQLRLK